mgnify:CR=1 FL=1
MTPLFPLILRRRNLGTTSNKSPKMSLPPGGYFSRTPIVPLGAPLKTAPESNRVKELGLLAELAGHKTVQSARRNLPTPYKKHPRRSTYPPRMLLLVSNFCKHFIRNALAILKACSQGSPFGSGAGRAKTAPGRYSPKSPAYTTGRCRQTAPPEATAPRSELQSPVPRRW